MAQFSSIDLAELNLPKTCHMDFPDSNDLLNFKLVICPDEVCQIVLFKEHTLDKIIFLNLPIHGVNFLCTVWSIRRVKINRRWGTLCMLIKWNSPLISAFSIHVLFRVYYDLAFCALGILQKWKICF